MLSLPNHVVEEQRALNRALRAGPSPVPGRVSIAEARRKRLRASGPQSAASAALTVRDDAIGTAIGPVRVRRFCAVRPRGTIIHFHGGGWVFGSVGEQDDLLSLIASETGSELLSIDYPLAPETWMPAAVSVATAAVQSILEQTSGAPLCIFGESAGAHLALVVVQRLRAMPALLGGLAAISLSYGIYDLSMTPSQRSWGDDFLGLSTPWLEWFYAQTLPGYSREQRSDPSLSPLYADLSDLPPVLLVVGSLDPLVDDSAFLYERLRLAGNRATLAVYPDAPHGFNHADTHMALRCNADIVSFMRGHLADASEP